MGRIYFDYAASTPVDRRVEAAMRPYWAGDFGNSGSLHSFGQDAIQAVDEAREALAGMIGADFREFIFTGSATEANNLALRGALRSVTRHASSVRRPRIIVSAVEHESVLETARDLEREGAEIKVLPVDRWGRVQVEKLKELLDERTILVSVVYANNEIGTVQPITEIGKLVADFRNSKSQAPSPKDRDLEFGARNLGTTHPLFHTDAAQAFQFLNCNVKDLGVDLMTISAHKIYGPKGIGALYVRGSSKSQKSNPKQIPKSSDQSSKDRDLGSGAWDLPAVSPLVTGGGQEFGLRSGTENVPLIVGFEKAAALAVLRREKETTRMREIRERFLRGLKRISPDAGLNGPALRENALPNILSAYFPGRAAELLLMKFDLAGIAVSAGSACAARSNRPSETLLAIGLSPAQARESIRFSFGRPTTAGQVDKALRIVKKLFA